MFKTNHIDDLISSCISFLENNRFLEAAENLQDIAVLWAKGGLPLKSFLDMKSYIVESARKTNPIDGLENKLLMAEKELKETRTNEWQNQKNQQH